LDLSAPSQDGILDWIEPEVAVEVHGLQEGDDVVTSPTVVAGASAAEVEMRDGKEARDGEDGWWPSFPISSYLACQVQGSRLAPMISSPEKFPSGPRFESRGGSSASGVPIATFAVRHVQTDKTSSTSSGYGAPDIRELEETRSELSSPSR
jgi:hypothetical protein